MPLSAGLYGGSNSRCVWLRNQITGGVPTSAIEHHYDVVLIVLPGYFVEK
ncbi:MAG: hypothetical protein LBH31_08900 [Burkholderiaceae bacterium]|jgi:hypothetical protein|nr:hypothetical protein [Burkholderiaceae bacterium]